MMFIPNCLNCLSQGKLCERHISEYVPADIYNIEEGEQVDKLTSDLRRLQGFVTYLRDLGFRVNDLKADGVKTIPIDEYADMLDKAISFLSTVGEDELIKE